MCFSESASLAAFLVGIVSSVLCISLGTITDKIFGLYFGYVSLMQIIDYFLWRHPYCDLYNRVVTIIGMVLNISQPLVFGTIILWLNTQILSVNRNTILLTMVVYFVVAAFYSAQFFQQPLKSQCSLKNEDQHQSWEWLNMPFYFFTFAIYLFAIAILSIHGFPQRNFGIAAALTLFFTYFTSAYIYKQSVGSVWCFYSVFVPFLYYLGRILLY